MVKPKGALRMPAEDMGKPATTTKQKQASKCECVSNKKGEDRKEWLPLGINKSLLTKNGWLRCSLTAIPNKKGKRWERMAAGQKSIGHKKRSEIGKGGQEAVGQIISQTKREKTGKNGHCLGLIVGSLKKDDYDAVRLLSQTKREKTGKKGRPSNINRSQKKD